MLFVSFRRSGSIRSTKNI
ncbi:unnamed protein product [Calypogeia fissa]